MSVCCSFILESPPFHLPKPPSQALGAGLSSGPGRGQDGHLDCPYSASPCLFAPLKPKHSPNLTEARSPRQAGSNLWGLRLDHTQLRGLMRETDRAGEVVGGRARATRPRWRSQRCSARTGGSWRGEGTRLWGLDPARAAMWERGRPQFHKINTLKQAEYYTSSGRIVVRRNFPCSGTFYGSPSPIRDKSGSSLGVEGPVHLPGCSLLLLFSMPA